MVVTLTMLAALSGVAQADDDIVATAAKKPPVTIPFEKIELDNGLDVIFAEDHSVPFVWVNLWYNVGSKDEEPGRTGFAHLFEHLMFQGSEHLDDDYFIPLQAVGARINGTTSFDRTNYYEGVPAEQLPLALWLESDRMGWLLPALTPEKLKNQQDVVRNERRQRYENRPFGMVWVWLFEALYPEGHPYHTPTIGKHEDLEAATLDDVSAFFSTWYVPNNATITLAGDFDRAEAEALVKQYFGDIPRGADPTPMLEAPAELTSETVVRKEDKVPLGKVWIGWLTPKLYAQGDAEMDILSSALASGKDSRLYKHLVHDLQIAKDVEAYQYSARLQSQFLIEATAAPGHTTDEIVAEVDKLLVTLREEGPTEDEVALAKTNFEVGFYKSLRNISGKANQLSSYNTVTGDPDFIGKDLQRYLDLDRDAVHEAAKTYLPPDRRVVLHVAPTTKKTAPPAEEN
jgi:zinc protease